MTANDDNYDNDNKNNHGTAAVAVLGRGDQLQKPHDQQNDKAITSHQ